MIAEAPAMLDALETLLSTVVSAGERFTNTSIPEVNARRLAAIAMADAILARIDGGA